MFTIQFLAKLIVGLLTAWAICTAISAFFGVSIYFPFSIASDEPIPEYRWQSVRIGVFLSFAYYGIMYLINASKEVYPVHFLKLFLFMLSLSGVIFIIRVGADFREMVIASFLFSCALVLHLASRPKFRRYFGKRQ